MKVKRQIAATRRIAHRNKNGAARAELLRIMDAHALNCPAVAELVGRRPQTVRTWRSGKYPVPAYVITLLHLKLDGASR